MSTWSSAEVRCPNCAHVFLGRFLRGANATRSPEYGRAARDGTINTSSCPGCGVVRSVGVPMIYADPDQGQWIALVAGEPLEGWENAERTTLAATSSLSGAHIRVVFDPDELRERLEIWDRCLDDAAIECVKLRCLSEQPSIRGERERLRVTAIEDDGSLAISIRSREGVPRAGFRVAASVVDEVSRDIRWRERFPALFENGFVSIDRYLVG